VLVECLWLDPPQPASAATAMHSAAHRK
jgi:hypothetical protein